MDSWNTMRGFRLRELDKKDSLGSLCPSLSIGLDAAQLANFNNKLRNFPGVLAVALAEATEKTRAFTRREIVKGLENLVTLQPDYIRKAVTSRKSRQLGQGAEIRVASKPLPLIRYQVNPQTPPQLKGRAVSARPWTRYQLRKGGKKFYEQATGKLSAMFVQNMPKSDHIGAFHRKKNTGEIKEHYAPAVQYHMYADGFIDSIRTSSTDVFLGSLSREIAAILGNSL